MGCFSFLCKVCNEPINCGWDGEIIGEHCTLYLLENGRVLEKMTGQYNNYGCVYDDNREIVDWQAYDHDGICELMFSPMENCGIAVVHTDCYPDFFVSIKTRSDDAEGQGNGNIVHTTEGKFLHCIMESPKSDRPDVPEEFENFEIDKKLGNFLKETESFIEKKLEEK